MILPKKAIITAAGNGTRFLPATKAQPKEMLPIIDKPIIQYCVEEAVASGAKDVIIVTKKSGHATENHFDDNFELEEMLRETGKDKYLDEIKRVSDLANFIFLRQKRSMSYGNGTPLKIASDLVSDEPFFYMYGDDLTLSKVPVCQQLVEVYKNNPDAVAILAAQKVPDSEVHKYGVVKIKEGTTNQVESFVEKPKLEDAPSNLAVFGRFLFTPKILPIIEKMGTGKDGELWLTDAVNELAQTDKVLVHEIEGKWLTTGDPLNYFKTSFEFAMEREDLRAQIIEYVKFKLSE